MAIPKSELELVAYPGSRYRIASSQEQTRPESSLSGDLHTRNQCTGSLDGMLEHFDQCPSLSSCHTTLPVPGLAVTVKRVDSSCNEPNP